ncbi:integrase_H2C2 domain-containing protein [Trichonephila clavipes]|nr:integrase_H2C2 domain-containing protein [Trichonephila clavipes]
MDEANNFPLSAQVVMSDCYMDDILSGSESIEEEYAFLESDETKALGIIWNPKLDCFLFRIEQQRRTSFTKRMVLSTIARIFDPLGLLAPIITWAKIFMQRLWLLELGWSDELPFKEEKEWRQFIDSLEAVNNISIDRCIVIHRALSYMHLPTHRKRRMVHPFISSLYLPLEKSKSKVKKRGPLTTSEVNDAETSLIKQDQRGINLSVPSGNPKSLNIFQDDKGVLRVGGRLESFHTLQPIASSYTG